MKANTLLPTPIEWARRKSSPDYEVVNSTDTGTAYMELKSQDVNAARLSVSFDWLQLEWLHALGARGREFESHIRQVEPD